MKLLKIPRIYIYQEVYSSTIAVWQCPYFRCLSIHMEQACQFYFTMETSIDRFYCRTFHHRKLKIEMTQTHTWLRLLIISELNFSNALEALRVVDITFSPKQNLRDEFVVWLTCVVYSMRIASRYVPMILQGLKTEWPIFHLPDTSNKSIV